MIDCFRAFAASRLIRIAGTAALLLAAGCSSVSGYTDTNPATGGATHAGAPAAAGNQTGGASVTGGAASSTGGASSGGAAPSSGGSAGTQSGRDSGGAHSGGPSVAPSGGLGGAAGSAGSAGKPAFEGGTSGSGGASGSGGNAVEPVPTVGSGAILEPAIGPSPAFAYGEASGGYVLVKNWDFGNDGTIRSIDDLSVHFQYHDQFSTFSNKYGAYTVAPDREHALNDSQPVENVNTAGPVRSFQESSLKTYLVGLDGAERVDATVQKAGCGSFQAKWKLPKGGALLGMDLLWETRVRYVTPPYFWFAIWNSGNKWSKGAEMDLVESFGYDNGGGITNYQGSYWHSSPVGGTAETNYHTGWSSGMARYGITAYDPSEYHTWTWVYKADDTYESYNDGILVQRGVLHWTDGGVVGAEPIDMSFIFDAAWGHSQLDSVNKTLPVAEFAGKFYEWDYSRVYLRPAG